MQVSGYGVRADAAERVGGRRPCGPVAANQRPARSRTLDRRRSRPVLHAGTFALPPDRGDFGSGAVDADGPPATASSRCSSSDPRRSARRCSRRRVCRAASTRAASAAGRSSGRCRARPAGSTSSPRAAGRSASTSCSATATTPTARSAASSSSSPGSTVEVDRTSTSAEAGAVGSAVTDDRRRPQRRARIRTRRSRSGSSTGSARPWRGQGLSPPPLPRPRRRRRRRRGGRPDPLRGQARQRLRPGLRRRRVVLERLDRVLLHRERRGRTPARPARTWPAGGASTTRRSASARPATSSTATGRRTRSCSCRCADGSCDQRRVCCNNFRYGQCNTQVRRRHRGRLPRRDLHDAVGVGLRVQPHGPGRQPHAQSHNAACLPGRNATHIDDQVPGHGHDRLDPRRRRRRPSVPAPRGGRYRRYRQRHDLLALATWRARRPRRHERRPPRPRWRVAAPRLPADGRQRRSATAPACRSASRTARSTSAAGPRRRSPSTSPSTPATASSARPTGSLGYPTSTARRSNGSTVTVFENAVLAAVAGYPVVRATAPRTRRPT